MEDIMHRPTVEADLEVVRQSSNRAACCSLQHHPGHSRIFFFETRCGACVWLLGTAGSDLAIKYGDIGKTSYMFAPFNPYPN